MLKNQDTTFNLDKMDTHKKQWVFAGAAALALTGGAYVANNNVAHADTTSASTTSATSSATSGSANPAYVYSSASESHSANSSTDASGNTTTNNYNDYTKSYGNTTSSFSMNSNTPFSGDYQSSNVTTTVTKNATGGTDTVTHTTYYGNHNSSVTNSSTSTQTISATNNSATSESSTSSPASSGASDSSNDNGFSANPLVATDGNGWTGYLASSDATSSSVASSSSSATTSSSASAQSASTGTLPNMGNDSYNTNTASANPAEGTPAYTKSLAQLPYYLTTATVKVVGTNQGTHIVKPSDGARFNVLGEQKLTNGLSRYKVALMGDTSYITAKTGIFTPAYYGFNGRDKQQIDEFNQSFPKGLKLYVKRPIYRHSAKNFRDEPTVHYHKGDVLKINKIISFGNITRFITSDGHYVTSNRGFVQVIK